LLWDIPDDPRGELRWCLSKLHRVLDEPDRQRVLASGDLISLQLDDCSIDVLEITRAAQTGIAKLDADRLRALSILFAGDFLEGLELDRSPQFNSWVGAQRRRLRACHAALLEQQVRVLPPGSAAALDALEKWVELAPLDRKAHELLLAALARGGRLRDGEEHVTTATRVFESEGLDTSTLHEAWRKARQLKAELPEPAQASVAFSPQSGGLSVQTVGEQITACVYGKPEENYGARSRRASIAIMPLIEYSPGRHDPAGLGGALAHDIITRLAKLRSLAVIAQGTVFALKERGVGAEAAGRALNVDYVAGGSIRRGKSSITLMIELSATPCKCWTRSATASSRRSRAKWSWPSATARC
jgi:DNA-binding SARP family transcriptional activator/TolB-like protein